MTNMTADDALSALCEADQLRRRDATRFDALMGALQADLGRRDEMLTWLYVQRFLREQDASPESIRELLVAALCQLVKQMPASDQVQVNTVRSRKGRS